MSRSKESLLEVAGGFPLGETAAQFEARVREIRRLEKSLRSGRRFKPDEGETVLRRICLFKGIDFDEYEPPDD
jgi:hypothetical protein